jgi:hypothetical protein
MYGWCENNSFTHDFTFRPFYSLVIYFSTCLFINVYLKSRQIQIALDADAPLNVILRIGSLPDLVGTSPWQDHPMSWADCNE